VLEQTNISRSTFLPLATITVELEELSSHLENLLLRFLIGLGFDLFSEMNDRFELCFRFMSLWIILLHRTLSATMVYA
jgi:hypothetical protein